MRLALGAGKPGKTGEIPGIILEFKASGTADCQIGIDGLF
jgi:hypothetical protein